MKRPVASFDSRAPGVDGPNPGEVDSPEMTAAIAEARADAAAGRVTPQALLKPWLERWGKGDPGPAPRPWKALG